MSKTMSSHEVESARAQESPNLQNLLQEVTPKAHGELSDCSCPEEELGEDCVLTYRHGALEDSRSSQAGDRGYPGEGG